MRPPDTSTSYQVRVCTSPWLRCRGGGCDRRGWGAPTWPLSCLLSAGLDPRRCLVLGLGYGTGRVSEGSGNAPAPPSSPSFSGRVLSRALRSRGLLSWPCMDASSFPPSPGSSGLLAWPPWGEGSLLPFLQASSPHLSPWERGWMAGEAADWQDVAPRGFLEGTGAPALRPGVSAAASVETSALSSSCCPGSGAL